jgi:hypothetical protein
MARCTVSGSVLFGMVIFSANGRHAVVIATGAALFGKFAKIFANKMACRAISILIARERVCTLALAAGPQIR